jgi:hypothetical protein
VFKSLRPSALLGFLLFLSWARAEGSTIGLGLGVGVGCSLPEVSLRISQREGFIGLNAGFCESWRFGVQGGVRLFSSPFSAALGLDVVGGSLGFGLQALFSQSVLPLSPLLPWPGVSLEAGAGVALVRLPLGNWIPNPRVVVGLQVIWSAPSLRLGSGQSGVPFSGSGVRECSSLREPTPESLLATFESLVASTKSSVIASLSGLYADFLVEYAILDVQVSGNRGVIRGTYNVGATRKSDGRRLRYSGSGQATFEHDGCSWRLVDYKY